MTWDDLTDKQKEYVLAELMQKVQNFTSNETFLISQLSKLQAKENRFRFAWENEKYYLDRIRENKEYTKIWRAVVAKLQT